eukprot:764527-Hanusia_phi.AAC.4
MRGHTSYINHCVYSIDGMRIISSGSDGYVKLFVDNPFVLFCNHLGFGMLKETLAGLGPQERRVHLQLQAEPCWAGMEEEERGGRKEEEGRREVNKRHQEIAVNCCCCIPKTDNLIVCDRSSTAGWERREEEVGTNGKEMGEEKRSCAGDSEGGGGIEVLRSDSLDLPFVLTTACHLLRSSRQSLPERRFCPPLVPQDV